MKTLSLDSKYVPWLLGFSFLVAFTWTAPFRDLYGIEARNALMAKEMLQKGIGFVPTVMGRPYPDYPPLYFWLVVIFFKLAGGVSTLAAVLPSALSAAVLIVVTFVMGSCRSARTAMISALVLGTFPEFWFKASKATIDMMLALEITLALFFLWSAHNSNKGRMEKFKVALGVGLATLGALFTKGPVGVVLIGAVWACYLLVSGNFKGLARFSLLYGLAVVCCAGIYLLVVWHEGGVELVKNVINSQVLGRVGGKPNKSFLYYEKYILEATAPWWFWAFASILAWKNSRKAKEKEVVIAKRQGNHSLLTLAVVWCLVVLFIFSVASSRHGRYLLPAFPAFAIITFFFVEKVLDSGQFGKVARGLERIIAAFFLVIMAGVWISYFAVDLPGKVGILWLAIWFVGLTLFWFEKEKLIPIPSRIFVRQMVLMVAVLSSISLLVYPVISQRESGKSFVKKVEARVTSQTPVVLFKIKRDGDGVKYALYSKRSPSSLKFISSIDGLAFFNKPCLLVTYQKDVQELLKSHKWKMVPIAQGLIHHKPVVAYLLEEASIS